MLHPLFFFAKKDLVLPLNTLLEPWQHRHYSRPWLSQSSSLRQSASPLSARSLYIIGAPLEPFTKFPVFHFTISLHMLVYEDGV